MVNLKFGKLLVLNEKQERSKYRYIIYNCLCECGNYVSVSGKQLRRGTKSCGCLRLEAISKEIKKTEHPLYATWLGMKQRCLNPNNHKYKYYGGRGIKICDEWLNSFENFAKDLEDKPKNTTLDRINNNGNYCKENCKWSTMKEQAKNRRKRNSATMR